MIQNSHTKSKFIIPISQNLVTTNTPKKERKRIHNSLNYSIQNLKLW